MTFSEIISVSGVKCHKGKCVGLLSQISLRNVIVFLRPMFDEKDKTTERKRLNRLINQIEHFNIAAKEAAKQMNDLLQSMKTLKPSKENVGQVSTKKRKGSTSGLLDDWQSKDILYWVSMHIIYLSTFDSPKLSLKKLFIAECRFAYNFNPLDLDH